MRQAGEARLRGRKKGGGIGGRWTLQNYGSMDPKICGEMGDWPKTKQVGDTHTPEQNMNLRLVCH